ncbi:MAG: decarboxylase [Candidatus Woesearchaeota archaeon]
MSRPFFELSEGKVMEQYSIVENLSDEISYSSKTNPHVTPILERNTDCMFSVHNMNELRHIEDKTRILYLAQGWDDKEISYLMDQGISRFAVDNKHDLERLLAHIEKGDRLIDLFLRVKMKENSVRTERHFVFGFDSSFVNENIMSLKENVKIRSLGLHFHKKTQNISEWGLLSEVKEMFDDQVFNSIDHLNIGGGLPSVYANTNTKVFNHIYQKITELKAWLNEKKIKLMIEPGRFISAPSAKLVTHIKMIHDNNIIVDASVYNSDMDAILVPIKLIVEGEKEKGSAKPYVVKGMTPCSMDIFRYRVYLESPQVGDELVFLNAGAYNFASDFCDLDKPETRVVD